MPTIYPDLNLNERINKLKTILNSGWHNYTKDFSDKEELKIRKKRYKKEFQVIEDCNEEVHIADYFY